MVRKEVTCSVESRQEIKNTLDNLELSKSTHNPVPAFSFSFKYQVDSQLKVRLSLQKDKILEEEDVDDLFYEFDQVDVGDELLDAKEGEEEEDIDIVDAVNMEKNLGFGIQTMPIHQEDENSLADDNEEEQEGIVNSDMENDLSSLVSSDREHPSPLSIASLDSALQDSVLIESQTQRVEDDETDQVYKKYCERMRWYDILSRDRSYGLSVITNQLTASSLSLWGKPAEKRIKQSMKKDLELVYVAQSCLSWEALQHQYITVRDSSNLADSRGRFYDSREFQNFQVLLERFLEDERCEGKRVLSFVQRRFELISFFQVPRLSGYVSTESLDVNW
ncbi:unnamed protein product [Arabidopsis arenosa]|uniref:Uncharacterized protein n=1 Tax=Arabidopsis arenosa TaxID=38785 RepID=A0A8S1ZRY8_ARAAE|nr:unnamed protein product [Arabidopsis arenosa]